MVFPPSTKATRRRRPSCVISGNRLGEPPDAASLLFRNASLAVKGIGGPSLARAQRRGLGSALLIVVIVTAGVGTEARGGSQPSGPPILFVQSRLVPEVGRTSQIVRVDGQGRGLHVLTEGSVDLSPRLSPDRKLIAFYRDPGTIVVMASDGRDPRIVGRGDTYPAWSPSSREIAYSSVGPPGIYVVDLGANVRRLTTSIADRPRWSPDGKTIAFRNLRCGRRGTCVGLIRAAGQGLRTLPGRAVGPPKWSPDGHWLLFTRSFGEDRTDLMKSSASGSNTVRLTRGLNVRDYNWSPNGRQIAMTVGRPRHGVLLAQICTLQADGKNLRRLTKPRPRPPLTHTSPVWSASGKRIAYLRVTGLSDESRATIWVMNGNGSGTERVVSPGILGDLTWGSSWSESSN